MLRKFIWPIAFVAVFTIPTYMASRLGAQSIQQPQELTFKVTPVELDVLAKGLESQPYKDVVPLLQKLREQFAAQQAKPEAVPVPTPRPAEAPVAPSVVPPVEPKKE